MAAGGHFGFWLLQNSAANFARVMGARFFSKYPKKLKPSTKPYYALGGHGVPRYHRTMTMYVVMQFCSAVVMIIIRYLYSSDFIIHFI